MKTRLQIELKPASDRWRRRLLPLWLSAVVLTSAAARADNVDGAWSQVYDWPLISVHAALTPDGRVLTYGTKSDGTQTGYFIYDVWDPTSAPDSGHMTLSNMTLTDIFCSSQIILPQSGDILISGGDNWTGTGTTNTGNNNSNLFDYGDNTLARSANMNRARWYSSATAMVDGSIYIQGGSGGADFPELRKPDGNFQLLSGAPTGAYARLFPRNFLAPDGRVFGYDTNGKMYFVSTGGAGSLSPSGQFASSSAGWTSGAAMFAPGRILQVGAGGSVVIDINGPSPVVTPTQHTSSQRRWVSLTVTPIGSVVATGGSRVDNQLTDVNNFAEIWDPASGTWHVGAEGALARLYHSAALLLPDASILVAGGGAPGPLVNTNAEIYYPPYLFNDAGEPAMRPVVENAPFTAQTGDILDLQVSGSISRVTMVKAGSVTHSVNMDQRFVELDFTASGNTLAASVPDRDGLIPPGYYLLFVINDEGVPSEGHLLRINIDQNPNTAVDYTPTIGGAGGTAFELQCPADQTLVGVHGRQGSYVEQIGPKCVRVDQFGRWIGDPTDGTVTGTTETGTPFSKQCARDHAVDGFRGMSGQYVDSIDISCRELTASGTVTGDTIFLGSVGGNGGSASGPMSCETGNPAYALYGRSGGWLDSIGLQCRPAPITPISTNSVPVVVDPGDQNGTVDVFADITIQASDGDGDVLTFSATGLPPGLGIDSGSGRIHGTPTDAGTFAVVVTATDGIDSGSASFDWHVASALPLSVDPMPPQPPAEVDVAVSYTASAQNGINRVYKWDFGDGTPETSYSDSPTVSYAYASPGVYYVTLTVNDDRNEPIVQTFAQAVHMPLTSTLPSSSSNIAYQVIGGGNDRLWVVNQDTDTVSAFDAVTNVKLGEAAVGRGPRAIAVAPNGRIWVTNKLSSTISVINPPTRSVSTLDLPHNSEPYGIAFSPTANRAYVVLEATGRLLVLDGTTGSELGAVDVGPHPRHVSVNADGSRAFVSRHLTPRQPGEGTEFPQTHSGGSPTGGEIVPVDTQSLSALPAIILQHSELPDFENQGGGVPNYLGAMAISPDGTRASVPSKQDNILRGTLLSGANLNFQNTVRAITSSVNLANLEEIHEDRIDYDNASLASAVAYGPWGVYKFVALETSREVAVVDVHGGFVVFRIGVGRAPQGIVLSADGRKLFVNNFMDRTIGVYDLSGLYDSGQWDAPNEATLQTITAETLDPQVLLGKQLFYDAADDRLARDDYMSCATCHNDGGHDGRVWDLTGMGEGLRNTISLRGSAASQGRLHWSQNFDEVHDFEGQIRSLAGGSGLMSNEDFYAGTRNEPLGDPKAGISTDLDALAAYVESLDEYPGSPYRNADGSLTLQASAGRDVFAQEGCGNCHGGTDFTDSDTDILHDIGTLKPSSGQRLDGPLPGIDTPTLRGIWATAPYLHDGSAATIEEAVAAHDGVNLDSGAMADLVAYLLQIDDHEVTAPPPAENGSPVLDPIGSRAIAVQQNLNFTVSATDPDGDNLIFSVGGLPSGASFDGSTGVFDWTPDSNQIGGHTVTFTVTDDGNPALSDSEEVEITVTAAGPVSVTLTGPGATTDSMIVNQQYAQNSFSGSVNLYIGSSADQIARGLIRWDLSAIPAGSTIISAEMSLYARSNVAGGQITIDAYRLLRPGLEAATWNTPWDTPGAGGSADRAPDSLASASNSGTGWYTWDITLAAQQWVDGTWANDGLLLSSASESQNNAKIFVPVDHQNQNLVPRLTIEYSAP